MYACMCMYIHIHACMHMYVMYECVYGVIIISFADPNMSGGHSYTHELLEHENNQLVDQLSDKVAALKSVSTTVLLWQACSLGHFYTMLYCLDHHL